LFLGKTKSGFPKTEAFRLQPVMPYSRKSVIIRNSVSRFPLPRIRDITAERLVLVKTSGIIGVMNSSLYTRAQRAMADLKGAVYELIAESESPLSNAEIGRRLGIYQGHVGHEGHISRTVLGLLEAEEVIVQDKESKMWRLRESGKTE
jgi:hypothetical protein